MRCSNRLWQCRAVMSDYCTEMYAEQLRLSSSYAFGPSTGRATGFLIQSKEHPDAVPQGVIIVDGHTCCMSGEDRSIGIPCRHRPHLLYFR